MIFVKNFLRLIFRLGGVIKLWILFGIGEKLHYGGVAVAVFRSGEHDGDERDTLEKVKLALMLIEKHSQMRFNKMSSDIRGILVIQDVPQGAMGLWAGDARLCLLDLAGVEKRGEWETAAVIIHEATHARHWRRRVPYPEALRKKSEAACIRPMLRLFGGMKEGEEKRGLIRKYKGYLRMPDGMWVDTALAWDELRRASGRADEADADGDFAVLRTVLNRWMDGWRRRVLEAERRGSEKCLREAGFSPGLELELEEGGLEECLSEERDREGVVFRIRLKNLTGEDIKVLRAGWWGKDIHGEWEEIVGGCRVLVGGGGQDEIRSNASISTLNLIQSDRLATGVKWACVCAGGDGKSYADELMMDPSIKPRKWRRGDGLNTSETDAITLADFGIGIHHLVLNTGDLIKMNMVRSLAGTLSKEYGHEAFWAYSTELKNNTKDPIKIVWMKVYENIGEGKWIDGSADGSWERRILGPADFLRGFKGESMDAVGWIKPGGAVKCNLSWKIDNGLGETCSLKWACLGIARGGRVFSGEAGVSGGQAVNLKDIRWR